jgi:hypothetical protein
MFNVAERKGKMPGTMTISDESRQGQILRVEDNLQENEFYDLEYCDNFEYLDPLEWSAEDDQSDAPAAQDDDQGLPILIRAGR